MFDTKILVKKLHKILSETSYSSQQRARLLAYAFLRKKPYRLLEKKIQQDHPVIVAQGGRNTFFYYQAYAIAKEIESLLSAEEKKSLSQIDIREQIKQWFLQEKL